ncbi:MAG: phosphotransferase [Bifidobacteriaceae bacterium]|nr:phosphotransferase [Bifidobacteriaceae bacterium]
MANLQTNPLALAALATAAVPRLDVVGARVEHIGADYAFAHVEDKSGRIWVVRLARHAAAAVGQESELALLKSLAGASSGGALPFEVPRPRGVAELACGGQAIVYAALPGAPVVMELMDAGPGIAESLGRAIAAFHELPPAIVTDAGLPSFTPAEHRARLKAEVDDAARTGHVSSRLENRWREQLDRDAWWVFTPVPIHGDMAAEHLLENDGRISAVSDFASVQVSDPAEDLAQILAPLPPDVAGSVVGAYRRRRPHLDDPYFEDRAALLGEIAIIRWLRHGIVLDDPGIVADAREMLADLDQAVQEEQAAAARAAAAEAAAAAKLEAAKQAAAVEAGERREAALRASEAAARERRRATGSIPRVVDGGGEAAPGPAREVVTPKRQSIAKSGVSLWGRPKKSSSKRDLPAGPVGADGLAPLAGAGEREASPNDDLTDADPAAFVGELSDQTVQPDKGSSAERSDSQPSLPGVRGDGLGANEAAASVDSADSVAATSADDHAAGGENDDGSPEATQLFLPDFLKDEAEAPADLAAAAAQDETEALDRPGRSS